MRMAPAAPPARDVVPQIRTLLKQARRSAGMLETSLQWLRPERIDQSTAREVRVSQWHAGQVHTNLRGAHAYALALPAGALREQLVGAVDGTLPRLSATAAAGADLLVGADELAETADRHAVSNPALRAAIFAEAIAQGAAGSQLLRGVGPAIDALLAASHGLGR